MSDIEVIEIGNLSGPPGPTGPAGPQGTPGVGVPTGGTTNQVLAKTSNTNYAVGWQTPSTGGGGPTGPAGGSLTGTYPDPGLAPAAVANLDTFTTTLKGVTPASGGGTANFLRADGTWADPGSGGGGAPSGTAGGSLAGTYPNPTIAVNTIGTNQIIDGSIAVTDLANIAQNTVLGRVSAGAGPPSNLTAAQMATVIASGSGGGITNYLRADGTWAVPSGGGGTVLDVTAVQAGNYVAAANEFVLFDTTAASRTLTLPTAPANGTIVGARIVTLGVGNVVNVNCAGADVFGKTGGPVVSNSALIYLNQAISYVYDTGIWTTMSGYTPLSQTDTRYVQIGTQTTLTGTGDLVLGAAVGGVASMDVSSTSHNLWTPLFVRATVDDPSPANNTGAVHDDPVLTLALLASSTYVFEAQIYIDSNATADARFNFSVPAGATGDYFPLGQHITWGGTGAGTLYPTYYVAFGGGDTQLGMAAAGIPTAVYIRGHIVTSTTAGNITFRYAQATATVVNTIRKAGSSLLARKVA